MDFKHSTFYFGHIVRSNNCKIPFREENDTETRIASIKIGAYTLTEFLNEIASALGEAGTQDYTVTVDRATRIITVEAETPFQILFHSALESEISARTLMGFPDSDTEMSLLHEGTQGSGQVYSPQAPINRYVPFEHWKGSPDSAITVAANGRSVIVGFNDGERMECDIHVITNKEFPADSLIRNNPTAKEDTLAFLQYLITKNPVEFMFDLDTPQEFTGCILEGTKESKSGTSFKLYEGLGKGLKGYYSTDLLTFRRIY